MFEKFPIMFFAVIMGLCGFILATLELGVVVESNVAFMVSEALRWVCLGLFVVFVLCYGLKILSAIESVRAELHHPIKINFFATFSISLLLLAKLFERYALAYDVLFFSGLVLQTFLTFYVVAFWIRNNMELKHSNPAWFIPIVGNIIVVAAGKSEFGFLWYYFDIAMFFISCFLSSSFIESSSTISSPKSLSPRFLLCSHRLVWALAPISSLRAMIFSHNSSLALCSFLCFFFFFCIRVF